MKQAIRDHGARALGFVLGLAMTGSAFAAVTSIPTSTVKGRVPVAAPTLDNAAPKVGDRVTASSGFSDADGDAEQGTSWRWLLDGNPIAGAVGNAYTLIAGDGNGRQLVVEATPASDPAITDPSVGSPVSSTAITTQGTAPLASVSAIMTPYADPFPYPYHWVTADYYAYRDADGDAESGSTFDWLLDGVSIGSGSISSGETKRSPLMKMEYVGKSLAFSVTPRSSTGTTPSGTATSGTAYTVKMPPGLRREDFFPIDTIARTKAEAEINCSAKNGRLPSLGELELMYYGYTTAFKTADIRINTEMCTVHGWPLATGCGGTSSGYWTTGELLGAPGDYVVVMASGEILSRPSYEKHQVACVRT